MVPRQLPAALRHFVGRAVELRALARLLDQPGVPGAVVISAIGGTAGVGKTAPTANGISEDFADYAQALAWFQAEHQVLIAAVGLAERSGLDTHAWQLPWSLMTFLELQGLWHDGAVVRCSQAISLCSELGDRLGEAAGWDSLGWAHRHLGDYPEAVRCYQHAVDLTGQLGDRYHQADAFEHLGDTHQEAGSARNARRAWQQALAILNDLDHPYASQVMTKLELTT